MTVYFTINRVPKVPLGERMRSFKFQTLRTSYGFMAGVRLGRYFSVFRFNADINKPGFTSLSPKEMEKALSADRRID